jgi:hypothetical protein
MDSAAEAFSAARLAPIIIPKSKQPQIKAFFGASKLNSAKTAYEDTEGNIFAIK